MSDPSQELQNLDCFSCKVIGSGGMLGVSSYLFYQSFQVSPKHGKGYQIFLRCVAAGSSTYFVLNILYKILF